MSETHPIRMGLVGSTGLVGRTVMETLVGREDFRLVAISRREVKLPQGARMEMRLADPAQWGEVIAQMNTDVLVCALGTTWRKAGEDEAAFRAVDEKLVLAVARAAKEAGVRQFIYVSSAGANPLSKTFYLRVKGEVEKALIKLRFTRLDILRPGLLRGQRERDPRWLESMAMLLAPIFDHFLRGRRRRFRSISAEMLVVAILSLSKEKAGGRFVHEYEGLRLAAKRHEGKA
jgi:uncharacterized protein YbjT (DUF2867 family)